MRISLWLKKLKGKKLKISFLSVLFQFKVRQSRLYSRGCSAKFANKPLKDL